MKRALFASNHWLAIAQLPFPSRKSTFVQFSRVKTASKTWWWLFLFDQLFSSLFVCLWFLFFWYWLRQKLQNKCNMIVQLFKRHLWWVKDSLRYWLCNKICKDTQLFPNLCVLEFSKTCVKSCQFIVPNLIVALTNPDYLRSKSSFSTWSFWAEKLECK